MLYFNIDLQKSSFSKEVLLNDKSISVLKKCLNAGLPSIYIWNTLVGRLSLRNTVLIAI